MNWDRLTRTSAPASDPVTLSEAKSHLYVTTSDDDTYIATLIDAAVEMIDGPTGIGICMVSQGWRLTLDCFPAAIRLPLTPVISVDSITYTDADGNSGTALASSGYQVLNAGDTVLIKPAYGASWPTTRAEYGAVVVNFTAGFSSVPAKLKHAVLQIVALWYEQRLPIGDADMLPLSAEHILNQYRAGTVA